MAMLKHLMARGYEPTLTGGPELKTDFKSLISCFEGALALEADNCKNISELVTKVWCGGCDCVQRPEIVRV